MHVPAAGDGDAGGLWSVPARDGRCPVPGTSGSGRRGIVTGHGVPTATVSPETGKSIIGVAFCQPFVNVAGQGCKNYLARYQPIARKSA